MSKTVIPKINTKERKILMTEETDSEKYYEKYDTRMINASLNQHEATSKKYFESNLLLEGEKELLEFKLKFAEDEYRKKKFFGDKAPVNLEIKEGLSPEFIQKEKERFKREFDAKKKFDD